MLTLTRRPGEAIVIGNVTIHIASVGSSRVSLCIDAPDDVVIMRAEFLERQKNLNTMNNVQKGT